MLTLFAPMPARPPRTKDDRLVKIYDQEVEPLVGKRLAGLLLHALGDRRGEHVLELGCRTGAVTEQLLARLPATSRIVALDASQGLIDRVRTRIGPDLVGRRLFLRTQELGARLPVGDDTYDLVVANLAWPEVTDRRAALEDLARVLRPGGHLVVVTTLQGCWAEPLDLFSEVLFRLGRTEPAAALRMHLAGEADADRMERWLHTAGLEEVTSELSSWELLFRSAREFFYAPVIEHGPLVRWKEIAGRGPAMHEVFFAMKEAIDTYFAGHPFPVSFVAGAFAARKPDLDDGPTAGTA